MNDRVLVHRCNICGARFKKIEGQSLKMKEVLWEHVQKNHPEFFEKNPNANYADVAKSVYSRKYYTMVNE